MGMAMRTFEQIRAGQGGATRRAFVAAAGAAAAGAALGSGLGLAPEAARAADAPADEVVIFHTNDVHGHLVGDGSTTVGIDVVAGLRKATPNSLLVDAGDATQGMPIVTLEKGASAVELMNAAGYDAMCVGNHEFDFGRDVLLDNAAAMEFPLLAANVIREDGEPLLEGVGVCGDGATAVLECAGRRIGVFGLVTRETPTATSPSCVEGLEFRDEIETAEACIAQLAQQGLDAIVALCHMGNGAVPCTAPALAQGLSDEAARHLTAIVDGHSHTVENAEVNGILVVQTGCNLAAVGKLTLAFGQDGEASAREELIDVTGAVELAQADPAVAGDLADLAQQQEALMAEKLFETPTTLWGGWVANSAIGGPSRLVETNMGDVVADAMRACAQTYLEEAGLAGNPVVGAMNGGSLRQVFSRGAVSRGDLASCFPFSNTVVLKRVTPAVLKEVLEISQGLAAGQDEQTGMLLQDDCFGGFLQVAGVTVELDLNAEQGSRVVSMTLDGADELLDPADDETPIVFVSSSFIMDGGNGYDVLASLDRMAEVGGDLETVQAYFVSLAQEEAGRELPVIPLYAGTEGRLQMRGGYEPAPWTCMVRVVDGSGAALPNTALTVEVDASQRLDLTSDADGLVVFEVEDGPHAVAYIPPDAADDYAPTEVLVDNYLGFGLVEDELHPCPSLVVEG